ncbi:MAG: patatin-like phospholipase family protein, partial [Bacteroidota bacterium]
MKVEDFTGHQDVQAAIKKLKESKKGDLLVSDLIDEAGHQYVDLVQEGGGVLGIALVGYIYVLEEMGIRFLSLAGTSAGSITTLLLAASGKPQEKKSRDLIEIISNKDFYEFVDGPKGSRKLIRLLTQQNKEQTEKKPRPDKKPKKKNMLGRIWNYTKTVAGFSYINLFIPQRLYVTFGLNPGQKFYNWLV